MKTPAEVLQSKVNEMTADFARILKLEYMMNKDRDPKHRNQFIEEKFETLDKINARINEFNNAISKLL